MSVEWMANVRDNESVSGSYNLYETVSNKTWMSAYKSLKSVTYQWMHTRYLNRGVALKQCKLDSQECFFDFRKSIFNVNSRLCVLGDHISGGGGG